MNHAPDVEERAVTRETLLGEFGQVHILLNSLPFSKLRGGGDLGDRWDFQSFKMS